MDIKNLSIEELNDLACDIRAQILQTVSQNGGHLSSNLGVVELSIGMHYVFNNPSDPFIFDVSHQCYTHKILTKRGGERFMSLRKFGGISGYTNPNESECDFFVAGHSSTSISLALGLCKSIALKAGNRVPVVLIGDGALSAGQAYEALNELGDREYPCVIILNDNEMSISKPVGAISKFISHMMAGKFYQGFKAKINALLEYAPQSAAYMAKRLEEGMRLITPGLLFEELGLEYIGPINGHDIKEIITTLNTAKQMQKPVIVHAQTIKGKGYAPAEGKLEKWHGVAPFDIKDYEKSAQNEVCPTNFNKENLANFNKENLANFNKENLAKTPQNATKIFSQKLLELATKYENIVGVTAAMPSGTGMDALIAKYPQRFWDVAIAEQHAITSMAAMAKEGFKPFVAIYSTFLQRAYDQIIHDCAILDLPVVLCIDRAGIVGEDGPTHQGAFDISFLNALPNIMLCAPRDENSFKELLSYAYTCSHLLGVRYPRGSFICDKMGFLYDFNAKIISENKDYKHLPAALANQNNSFSRPSSQLLKEANSNIAFIGYGNGVGKACLVASILEGKINPNIIDLVFVKPLDKAFLKDLASKTKLWYIFSDSAKKGGVGEILSSFLQDENIFDVKIKSFEYDDYFIAHGSLSEVEKALKISAQEIASYITSQEF